MKTQLSLKKAQGFSLVELLIVIAVIAVIAAIAIPNIAGVTDNAKRASAKESAVAVITAWNSAVAAGVTNVPTTNVAFLTTISTAGYTKASDLGGDSMVFKAMVPADANTRSNILQFLAISADGKNLELKTPDANYTFK